MPPKLCQNLRNSAEWERSLLLTISALKNQETCNIREAARIYNVPRSTLQDRLRGKTTRSETHTNSYKLTQNEEESLI
jgi:predicted transcriptional regulator